MKALTIRRLVVALATLLPLAASAAPVSRYADSLLATGSISGGVLAVFGTLFLLACN